MMAKVFKNIPTRKIFRSIILVLFLSSFLVYRFIYNIDIPSCLVDKWHVFTASANNNLDINNNDNIVIGIGQVIMDSWIVLTFIFWYLAINKGLLSSRTPDSVSALYSSFSPGMHI